MSITFFILEAYISKFHISTNMREFNCIRCILDIWLHFQYFHEPLKAGNPLLVESSEIAEPLYRLDQNPDVQQKGDQIRQIERNIQNGNTAKNNDSNYEQLCRSGHSSREICLIAIDIPAAVNETIVGVCEFPSFHLFICK